MDEKYIKQIIKDAAEGKISQQEAYDYLKHLPYDDFDYVKIDNHRALRTGWPEVVFCPGKKSEQIAKIMDRLAKSNNRIMATRATEKDYEKVKELLPEAVFYETAGIISIIADKTAPGSAADDSPVAVITAGTADIPVAEEAAVTFEIMTGIRPKRIFDVGVSGIHRILDQVDNIRNCKAVIVVAGMEGALPSVVGGLVDCPVIAVPTSIGYGSSFEGLAALLGMLNSCANGIATVNIDNGYGAAYLAAQIVSNNKK